MWTSRPALYPALRVGLEGVRSHSEPADLWSWGSGKPCRSSGAKGPGGTPEHRRRCSIPRLSVRVGGYGRVWPLPQGPTGLGRSRRGLGEGQVQRSCRRCACVRARVCWGDADAREPRIPPTDTAAHHTRGHTQDTHAEGEGHAARGQGLSAPPKPASLAPSPTPARGAEGRGVSPAAGRGRAGLRGSGRPRSWGRGRRRRHSPAPAKLLRQRPLAPRWLGVGGWGRGGGLGRAQLRPPGWGAGRSPRRGRGGSRARLWAERPLPEPPAQPRPPRRPGHAPPPPNPQLTLKFPAPSADRFRARSPPRRPVRAPRAPRPSAPRTPLRRVASAVAAGSAGAGAGAGSGGPGARAGGAGRGLRHSSRGRVPCRSAVTAPPGRCPRGRRRPPERGETRRGRAPHCAPGPSST